MSAASTSDRSSGSERLKSLDAFRGFTILGMVFVIAIAAGNYQAEPGGFPQTRSWFGSLPISTWFHADTGYEVWEGQQQAAGKTDAQIKAMPEYQRRNVGLTFTDLIAPWFVFIVGVCVPLSKSRRGDEWFTHAFRRAMMLILAGVLYMALVLRGVTWWWGVLQAIGVAYFMAAALMRFSPKTRWIVVFGVGFFHLLMSEMVPLWTNAFHDIDGPFGTLSNPSGSWLKPWIVHCLPWVSISYGVMSMIGVLVGESLLTRDSRAIITRSLLVGAIFSVAGYVIHKIGYTTGRFSLCFDKPDVTTSYAFTAAGLGSIVFCGFFYLIDVLKIRGWSRPLLVFGANPLLTYFMMIILRRAFETLGINGGGPEAKTVGFFNPVTPINTTVYNWAKYFGSNGQPAEWVLNFFRKSGYHGIMWGLIYTGCIWLVMVYCNRRKLFWRF